MATKYWHVKIPEGFWMCGTHSFNTKRAATEFAKHWAEVCEALIPTVCNSNPGRKQDRHFQLDA